MFKFKKTALLGLSIISIITGNSKNAISEKNDVKNQSLTFIEKGNYPNSNNSYRASAMKGGPLNAALDGSELDLWGGGGDSTSSSNVQEYGYTTISNKSETEKNNDFESANCISVEFGNDFIPLDEYEVYVTGKLHENRVLWWHDSWDEDYFYFNLYGDAEISICLYGMDWDCNYDIGVYKYYVGGPDSNDVWKSAHGIATYGYTNLTYSNQPQNKEEYFTRRLGPGQYFVKVYTANDKVSSNNYTLYVHVNYDQPEDLNIPEARFTKGAKGAVWLSDYAPYGFRPFQEDYLAKTWMGSTKNGSARVTDVDQDNRHLGPLERHFINQSSVKQASLYIWDTKMKDDMYIQVNDFLEQYGKELEKLKNCRIEKIEDGEALDHISTGISVAGTVVGFAITCPPAGVILGASVLVLSLVLGSFSSMADAFCPVGEIDDMSKVVNYLRNLRTALAWAKKDANGVLVVDSSYKVTNKIGIANADAARFDYYVTNDYNLDTDFKYKKDTIETYQEDAKFYGKIYTIVNDGDLEKATSSHTKVSHPVINTDKENRNIKFEEERTFGVGEGYLQAGEYHWYKFTAPSDGLYEFFTEHTNENDEDLDPFGELFDDMYYATGWSTSGRVDYNDNAKAGTTDFNMKRELRKGQTIYIRVSGSGWKTHGGYAFTINNLTPEAENKYLQINQQNLSLGEDYLGSNVLNKQITLANGNIVNMQSLRFAYVNDGGNTMGHYLTLSSMRNTNAMAYVYFKFSQKIKTFNFDMAFWDTNFISNLMVGGILIETNYSTSTSDWNYTYYKNIISDEISKDKQNLSHFDIVFPDGKEPYGVGILVAVNTGNYANKNRGRVVLDNMEISYL